ERDTGEYVTGRYLLARLNGNNRIDGEQVAGFAAAVHLGHDTAAGNGECWLETFTTLVAAPVDNDALGEAGSLVGVFRNGCTIDQVLEQNLALDFRKDRTGVRIPFSQTLATANTVAFLDQQLGTIGHLMGGAFLAVGIENGERD